VTLRLKAGIAKPEYMFIARQRLGKQVPEEMNMHATIELPFLKKQQGKHTSTTIAELLGNGVFCGCRPEAI
jgi:hypothetical protein